jgi:hypothetical protein
MSLPRSLTAAARKLIYADAETHYLLRLCASFRHIRMHDLVRELVRDEARRCGIELEEERA